ncbi:MAG: helicase-related protein [bacterium]
MQAGNQVRLISDPNRNGVILDNPPYLSGTGREFLVRFSERDQWIQEDQLELVPSTQEHPLHLFAKEKTGSVKDLRGLLTHIRLTGRLANTLYSMNTTNTEFYAYQFKPVLKMLDAPGKGILIADEVGLGKTIEAGLILTEFQSRVDIKRALVLCPAMLQKDKWIPELTQRFGIQPQLCNAAELLSNLETTLSNPNTTRFTMVGSLQGLRPHKYWWSTGEEQDQQIVSKLARFLREHSMEEPLIDLLIIDEAHYLRNPESQTAQLGRLLRDASEYIVLLSATPIHLRNEDLFQLLNLVDQDTFDNLQSFDSILRANEPLMNIRRIVESHSPSKSELITAINAALKNPLLKDGKQLQLLMNLIDKSDESLDSKIKDRIVKTVDSVNLLGNVITRTRRRDVQELCAIREPIPEPIEMTPEESIFYQKVTNFVREFCSRYDYAEGFLLTTPQRQMSSSMAASLSCWKERKELFDKSIEENENADLEVIEPGPLLANLFQELENFGEVKALREYDSKYNRLQEMIRDFIKRYPHDKIIIFSYFIATLDYLYERLSEDEFNCIVLHGKISRSKSEVLESFSNPTGPQILLSSEIGSEGIDLQFCAFLINYDLPWNPMRIEQRIGRIDRIGQKAEKLLIWYLFYKDTIDDRIYSRLYQRLQMIGGALGGIEPVLGNEIRKLTYELLSKNLSSEQEEQRIVQTEKVLENRYKSELELENQSAFLVRYGDYIIKEINAARELNRQISSRDLLLYTKLTLSRFYSGCQIQPTPFTEEIYEITLTDRAKVAFQEYIRKYGIQKPTQMSSSDPRPVRCIFQNKISVGNKEKAEIINQTHPLIHWLSSSLDQSNILDHPIAFIELHEHADLLPGIFIYVIERWSIEGLRDVEQIQYCALNVNEQSTIMEGETAERLVRTALEEGEDFLGAEEQIDLAFLGLRAVEKCVENLRNQYKEYVSQEENRNWDRVQIQERMLDEHLKKQTERRNSIIKEHQRNGRIPLAKAEQRKIELITSNVSQRKIILNSKKSVKAHSSLVGLGIIKNA